jgi:hypothetical protein
MNSSGAICVNMSGAGGGGAAASGALCTVAVGGAGGGATGAGAGGAAGAGGVGAAGAGAVSVSACAIWINFMFDLLEAADPPGAGAMASQRARTIAARFSKSMAAPIPRVVRRNVGIRLELCDNAQSAVRVRGNVLRRSGAAAQRS